MAATVPEEIPAWRGSIHDTLSLSYAEATEAFYSHAIKPSCDALAALLADTPRGDDNPSMDRWEDLRQTQLEVHRSFALSLNGLWERNFRRHLWTSAVLAGWRDKKLERTERDEWDKCFHQIRGFPMSKFSSYSELIMEQS